jgi:Na+/pantothenate symporter
MDTAVRHSCAPERGKALQISAMRRCDWLRVTTLVLPLVYSAVVGIAADLTLFLGSLIVLGSPAIIAWRVSHRIRRESIRRGLMIAVLLIDLLLFLFLLIGVMISEAPPVHP